MTNKNHTCEKCKKNEIENECVSCGEEFKAHNKCRLRACKRQYGDFYGFILK